MVRADPAQRRRAPGARGLGHHRHVLRIELLAVVNAHTGVVERLLDLVRDRSKGCCHPLDWVDEDTVLVHTDKEGLITWNVRTDAVAQVIPKVTGFGWLQS